MSPRGLQARAIPSLDSLGSFLRSTLVLGLFVLLYERTTTAQPIANPHAPALARRADHGSRISGQALAAIILCSAIVFCSLLYCLLQLPIVLLSRHNRRLRDESSGTTTPTAVGSTPGSGSMPDIFDLEMGDHPASQRLSRDVSPPPPYSRAPSYESSGNTSHGGERGGGCTS